MTRAHDQETARHSDSLPTEGSGAVRADDAPQAPVVDKSETDDDDVRSDLELLEATPTPVVLPLSAGELHATPPPPPPPSTAAKRPPPLPKGALPPHPPRTTPPPPPPRKSQPRPSVRAPAMLSASLAAEPAGIGRIKIARPVASLPKIAAIEPERFDAQANVADAYRRVEQMGAGTLTGDRGTLARARTELGLLLEVVAGDAPAALAEYRTAYGMATTMLPALAGARRLTPLRPAAQALTLLEAELRATHDRETAVTKKLELGMLLASSNAPAERTWQVYREVLATRPDHPGALRGLEAALTASARTSETAHQREAQAAHLQTMADVFRADARLSAWMHVERGQLLEKLGRVDAAGAAFEAALALDRNIGPVRDAYTQHLLLHDQVEALVEAWAAEVELEADGARAARLAYFAGRLAAERLDRHDRAVRLFVRSAAREDASPTTRRASLRELARLHELAGDVDAAIGATTQLLDDARDSELTYLHRSLIRLCAQRGHHAMVATHAQLALAAEPNDPSLRETLDRALATLGRHEQRVAVLADGATRTTDDSARIALLSRAAGIAERDWGRPDVALATLRSAFAIDAGNPDICDAIARLLAPTNAPSPTDPDDPSRARARIDFHVEAAAAATSLPRKIAHLEALAGIWEDEVQAPDRALSVFGEILALDPDRRSAVLGLGRCAARAGNARELLRALVLEASQAGADARLERALLLRAAEVASEQLADPDTALDLIGRVLAKVGNDTAALRAAFRVYERAGRDVDALVQLRLLRDANKDGHAGYALQSEIARFLDERMHRTEDAIAAWREAHRLSPSNATPRGEIRRLMLGNGDHRALADTLVAMATETSTQPERAELFLEAAEIVHDRLGDPERAIPLLVEARVGMPDDPAVLERLDRAYLRAGKKIERMALLHTAEAADARTELALGALHADERDPTRAIKRLTGLATDETTRVAALRTLERALRRSEHWEELDLVLRRQIECFDSLEAKLGSVFELVVLEEFLGVPVPDEQASARELLARLAPDDPLHHELFLRQATLSVQGQAPRAAVIASLAALAAAQPDALAASALQLAMGLLLEHAAEQDEYAQKQALLAYATCLESWPDCLSAARGARRLALRLNEDATFVKAASILGALELDANIRCERLLEAAERSRAGLDGPARAVELACSALGEDPSCERAADAVIAAAGRELDVGKACETLRSALDRVLAPDQAAKLGAALAYVAVEHLNDSTVAIEALRRARKRAPRHVGNLLTLAEASMTLGLHAEAVEAASSAMGISSDPVERLRASVTLAEVHARVPAFRETARREAGEAERMCELTGDTEAELVARLGVVYRMLGDEAGAERVLSRAILLGADNSLHHLQSMYGSGPEADRKVADVLARIMEAAASSGHPARAEWLAVLGRVEAGTEGKEREGLARVHEAVRMAPGTMDVYRALVQAHGNAHVDAARELLAGFPGFARSAPGGEDVMSMLQLIAQVCTAGERATLAAWAEDLANHWGGKAARIPEPKVALPGNAPQPLVLAREPLIRALFPDGELAPLLDVAAQVRGTTGKQVRQSRPPLDAAERDRLLADAAHPVRQLANRIARAFGELRFEVCVDVNGLPDPRLLLGDPCTLLLPPDFSARPEGEQAATMARLLTYVALDVPWLEALPPDEADGVLFGAVRAGLDLWGRGDLTPAVEASARTWQARLGRNMGRKVKRSVHDIAERARPQPDGGAFRQAVRIAAVRAGFVITGDLSASLAEAMAIEGLDAAEGELSHRVFADAVTRELLTFAFSDAGFDLCRAAGSV